MPVPYTFGSATTSIPLSQLDSNFATTITLGNTAIQLGNTVTTLNNMTLANVTISSGTSNLAATAITNGTSNVTIASSGGAVSMASNGAVAVTIDTSQNVGIGTASPDSSNKVQVAGDIATSWDANKFIGMKFAAGSSYKMGLMLNNSSRECKVWSQSSDSDDKITFYTGSTPSERARIDTSGNLLVGGTSRNGTGRVEIKCTNGVDNGLVCYTTASGGATGTLVYFLYNNTTFVGSITSAGASTSYGSISDYRLKENVQPMTGALSKVAQLKPCTYKWKSNGSDGQGFIAHELQAVVPDAVVGEKDAVDSDENPVYQNIDTSFLVATLTAAIQELKAINDTQAETINALTARIVALEAK